ncbi:Cyclophilin-like peptidyl-prolyl cis-trans isomerase family protein [Heracleum sosnowskyi]|uniref:Cyclophilin-like peptidyl-prolyl cis-trans isomerase family protein n=1 Tax=Heracleum sosnowskyi TaxID=360622 RepID=A0AAD8JGU0_9APIA|nr:Cyclophilin-like peptidyl-prolyl cis-trans isomerase family protein [Heracleum sosnowskyi]KAK1403478.1 Cyclophilin-like peptidyl-prolyl cis-trans isomerase family protein [Heracleum sosnowskyi]
MNAAAGHMILQCVFDSSLSMSDMDIERRPYHRNCSCALHKQHDTAACFQQGKVAFPKIQSWTDCSISATFSKSSIQSLHICGLSRKNKEKDVLMHIRNKGTDGSR